MLDNVACWKCTIRKALESCQRNENELFQSEPHFITHPESSKGEDVGDFFRNLNENTELNVKSYDTTVPAFTNEIDILLGVQTPKKELNNLAEHNQIDFDLHAENNSLQTGTRLGVNNGCHCKQLRKLLRSNHDPTILSMTLENSARSIHGKLPSAKQSFQRCMRLAQPPKALCIHINRLYWNTVSGSSNFVI